MGPFQIVSTSYRNAPDGPHIMVYGRDSDGVLVTHEVTDFKPYLYLRPKFDDKRLDEALSNFGEITEVLEDFKFLPVGYQTERIPVLKVYVRRPGDVPKIRDEILKAGLADVFEADVLFASSRFLADNRLRGMAWCELDETGHLRTINKPGNSPLKYMAFDIEVLVPEKGAPIASKDPVILISATMYKAGDKYKSLVLVAKSGNQEDHEDYSVKFCDNEAGVLEAFRALIYQYDPDIVMGFNSDSFDFPYIAARMEIHNLNNEAGRDGSFVEIRSYGTKHEVRITGRAVADLYPLVKKNYSLVNYKLSTISKTLLKRPKLDIKPSEMRSLWLSNDESDLKKFIDYVRRDADLVVDLAIDLRIIDKYIAISRESGCLLHDTINSGQQVKIELMLLREFVKEGRLFPLRKGGDEEEDSVVGAHVFEPETGLHENLAILDFKSLYPSSIRAYNICWSTVVNDKKPGMKVLTPPNNVDYIDHSVYHGIMPRIVGKLYDKRVEFKHLMKAAKTDSERDFYDAAQYSVKILLNSFYGFCGAPSSRLYDTRLANSITAIGRETIQLTKKTAESLLPCRVIGGDTDSIFLKLLEADNPDDAETAASIIHDEMLKILPPPMELDFEAFASRALIFQKKRYAMWVFERGKEGWSDHLKTRGIETRRRDWCPLVGETMTKVLEMILKEGKVEEACSLSMDTINRVKSLHNVNDDWDLAEKLILTKQVSRSFDDYSTDMPHVEVCKKMEARGETPFGLGDRVPYFIVPGALRNGIAACAEAPDFVREHSGVIDVAWYVEKQLTPPLERVFDAIGINMATGKKKPKQKDLFSFENGPSNVSGSSAPNKKKTGIFAYD